MCGANAHRECALNLGAQFCLHILRVDVFVLLPVMIEVSGFVDETRYSVCSSHWPPTVINSFARQSKVQTKVCIWMGLRVVSHLRKPGAGHHQARGINRPTL